MIYTSLAIAVLSASAAVTPLSNLIHLHPRPAQPDSRVTVTLRNSTNSFRDVRVDGRRYTIESHHTLTIKAPAGTVVYADSRTPVLKRGDVLLAITPQLDNSFVKVN